MPGEAPFDRAVRRVRRDRAAKRADQADYLPSMIAEEIISRLDLVTRKFADALVLGCGDGDLASRIRRHGMTTTAVDAGFLYARAQAGVQCDEDRLAIADGCYDLVVSLGVLDQINDLPGALALIRRVLRPNGLFLAAFAGAGSLPRLRSAMLAADLASGPTVCARIHPQIDVRAAGDLLVRAGFSLPVVDSHRVTVRFSGLTALVEDLRSWGATNILASRPKPLGRTGLGAALFDFDKNADPDGKTSEVIEIIHVTAWNASPDQPRPTLS